MKHHAQVCSLLCALVASTVFGEPGAAASKTKQDIKDCNEFAEELYTASDVLVADSPPVDNGKPILLVIEDNRCLLELYQVENLLALWLPVFA